MFASMPQLKKRLLQSSQEEVDRSERTLVQELEEVKEVQVLRGRDNTDGRGKKLRGQVGQRKEVL